MIPYEQAGGNSCKKINSLRWHEEETLSRTRLGMHPPLCANRECGYKELTHLCTIWSKIQLCSHEIHYNFYSMVFRSTLLTLSPEGDFSAKLFMAIAGLNDHSQTVSTAVQSLPCSFKCIFMLSVKTSSNS